MACQPLLVLPENMDLNKKV